MGEEWEDWHKRCDDEAGLAYMREHHRNEIHRLSLIAEIQPSPRKVEPVEPSPRNVAVDVSRGCVNVATAGKRLEL